MFEDREDAGRQLAAKLVRFKGQDAVVLALPRGGVVLGAEVARRLKLHMGLVLVRKIGHPYSPEYAIGALAEHGKPIFNQGEVATTDAKWLEGALRAAGELIEQRRQDYYGQDYNSPKIKNKMVILVDDGIATGLTMQAAIKAAREQGAEKVVVAVPVSPVDSLNRIKQYADETMVLEPPAKFLGAVGSHYRHFDQVDDSEVKQLLKQH